VYGISLTNIEFSTEPTAPVAAVAAGATEESAEKSTEIKPAEETVDAEEAKKTNKSRSRSRGAPSNIIGFFKGKKDEAKEETKLEDTKKEETVVPEGTAEAEAASTGMFTDSNVFMRPLTNK
jgi:hypothetical protein